MSIDQPRPDHDSALLAQARDKLRAKPEADRHWAALGAAAFFALCAMAFVLAAVLAPPLSRDPAAKVGVK
jgi:cytochrome c-type biogenesis protein CcmH/NrfG